MLTVTVSQFLKFGPCYSKKQIKEIAGSKKRWSALDILSLEDVPAQDRLWAVLREELIPAPILHEFACRCAEDALKLINKPDPRSTEAIRVKRLWVKGEATDEELAAAWDAAWAAARAAACTAAWAAARAAACTAAWAAAWAAARAAAWAAARAAAGDAALDGQVKLLIDMLTDE
jgi:hypothetical protein